MKNFIHRWLFKTFKEDFKKQEEWIRSSLIAQERENSDTEARMDVLEKQFLELFCTWQKPTSKELKTAKQISLEKNSK